MGKIRSFLGIFALIIAVLSSGSAFAATGYVCESYRKYTGCAENYYMATSADDLSYNNTPVAGNICAPCPAEATYCPGGTESPVYKLTLEQRLATTPATITEIYFQESPRRWCTDKEDCAGSVITQLSGNKLPQRAGYVFNCYSNDENDGDGDQYISETGLIDGSGDVTAKYLQQYPVWYAHWKGVSYNCAAGTYWNSETLTCEICTTGHYCPGVSGENDGGMMGQEVCYDSASIRVGDTIAAEIYAGLSTNFTSDTGAKKAADCYFDLKPGTYFARGGDDLRSCEEGFYCPGDRMYDEATFTDFNDTVIDDWAYGITSCPAGTSDVASDSERDCYFDVVLNPNNGAGTCATTQRCYYDTECTLPSWNSDTCNLSNGVKIFKGWATSNTATSGFASMAFTGATTVYAVWVAPTCAVTNGIGTPQNSSGNAPVCKVECTEGYNTSGTYTGTAGNSEYQYTCNANQYTVTYNSNKPATATGTVNGDMSDSQHVYDTEKALNNNTYALPGYVFAGWNTMANGTGTAYTNAQNVKNLTANKGTIVPLYAQWTPCATGTYCPGDNTVQTCPTDTLGRTVVSSTASDDKTDCYVTCGAKTIENGTTTVNATQINFNGTSYPECTYSVSCNSGFGAAGNNTATPTCTQCTSGTYSVGGVQQCLNCSDLDKNNVNITGATGTVTYSSVAGAGAATECEVTITNVSLKDASNKTIGTKTWTMPYNGTSYANQGSTSVVTSCIAGYYRESSNSTTCTQCTGARYCPGDMTVKSCPGQTDGWTRASGTGWDNYDDCYQTRMATDISDNCSGGQLKQTASSATTWGTATVSEAFTANAGAYVSGTNENTTCKLCEAGTYQSQDNSTATQCSACTGTYEYSDDGATQCQTCATGYQANTTHDACVARQFQVTYDCGDGTGNAPTSQTIAYMEQFKPATNTCNAPSGKKFSHWYDGTSQWTEGGSYQWTYTQSATLTAQYVAEDEKEITFNLGAENAKINGNDYTRYCNVDSGAFDLPTDVTRTAYKFAGWYNNADFSGNPITSVVAGGCDVALSFWAKWEVCDLSDGAGQCGCASDEYANGNGTCTSCVTSCSTLGTGEYKGEYNICANNGAGNAEEMCYTECETECIQPSSCPENFHKCTYIKSMVSGKSYYKDSTCVADNTANSYCNINYDDEYGTYCVSRYYMNPDTLECLSCETLPTTDGVPYTQSVSQSKSMGARACYKMATASGKICDYSNAFVLDKQTNTLTTKNYCPEYATCTEGRQPTSCNAWYPDENCVPTSYCSFTFTCEAGYTPNTTSAVQYGVARSMWATDYQQATDEASCNPNLYYVVFDDNYFGGTNGTHTQVFTCTHTSYSSSFATLHTYTFSFFSFSRCQRGRHKYERGEIRLSMWHVCVSAC